MFLGQHANRYTACLLLALAGIGGCASGGQQAKENTETAPQAWTDLENKAAVGGVLNIVSNNNPISQLLAQEQARANQEVKMAMQSPLPIEALDAMVDDVAQKMATNIPEVPEVKKSENQLILAFSTITDGSGSGNPQLVQALDSLRSKLSRSEKMTNNFVFVSTTETDAAKLNTEIAGKDTSAFRDPLQRTADNTHPTVYDPASIFLIGGSLLSTQDQVHHTVQVRLSLQFTHVQSRRLVENEEFVRTYMWHPTKHNWELQPS